MFLLFSLLTHNVTRYCLRLNDESLPQCPEETHIINKIEDFYNVLEPNAVADLLVINNEKTELFVDSKLLKNSAVDFTGVPTSIIDFTLTDQRHTKLDNIGFKHITVKFDSEPNVGFANFYLNDTVFIFAKENVTLNARKVMTDLRSISYFDVVTSTDFHLTTTDVLPKTNTKIYVRNSLLVEGMSSKSTVDVGLDELTMDYNGTIINFALNKSSSCLIEHNEANTLMDIFVHNVQRESYKDCVFTINATNGALLDIEYEQYIEESSPQVRVYISDKARFSSTSHNSPCAIISEGDGILDLTNSRNDLSFLSLTVDENSDLRINNENGLTNLRFTEFISFNENGGIHADKPLNITARDASFLNAIEVPNFLENIKLTEVKRLESTNSSSVVPYIELAKYGLLKYNFKMNDVKTLTINEFLSKEGVDLHFTDGNIPSDEAAQPFVDNEQYIIKSKTLNCEDWSTYISSTGEFDGFTEETSIIKGVCKKEGEFTLAGFKFIDTPMRVYPTFCYGEFCFDGYHVDASNVSEIGSLTGDSVRRIYVTTQEDMPDTVAFGFKGLKKSVDVGVYSITTLTKTNIRIEKDEAHISKLSLYEGEIHLLCEDKIKLPMIVFGQGCVISKEEFKTLQIDETTKVAIEFDALDQFPLDYFPNAIVPINEFITIVFNQSCTTFYSSRFPDTPTIIHNFTQTLEILPSACLVLKRDEKAKTITPVKVDANNNTCSVYLESEFNNDDFAIDFVGDANVSISSTSTALPFMFTESIAQLTFSNDNTNYTLNQKNFTATDILVEAGTNNFYIPNATINGKIFMKGTNVHLQTLKLESNSYLKCEDITFDKEFVIPKDSKVVSKKSSFLSSVTIKSDVDGRSGVLNTDKTAEIPKYIYVNWEISTLPEADVSAKSYVIISKDSLDEIMKVTKIDSEIKELKSRKVNAHLFTDNIGIYIEYESPYESNMVLYVGLISAGGVAIVALIVIIIVFCCCRRSRSRDAKLLSTDTLLALNSPV